MRFEFCIPTTGKKVPAGVEWFHEIKYDDYRIRLERDGESVRLITKGGYDWTKRYPRIIESALKNRQKRFVIDGEAIVRGVDGYSDFNALHSGKHNDEVELIAFDTPPWEAHVSYPSPQIGVLSDTRGGRLGHPIISQLGPV